MVVVFHINFTWISYLRCPSLLWREEFDLIIQRDHLRVIMGLGVLAVLKHFTVVALSTKDIVYVTCDRVPCQCFIYRYPHRSNSWWFHGIFTRVQLHTCLPSMLITQRSTSSLEVGGFCWLEDFHWWLKCTGLLSASWSAFTSLFVRMAWFFEKSMDLLCVCSTRALDIKHYSILEVE